MFKQIAILGVGLIGGALAKAIGRKDSVVGWSLSWEGLEGEFEGFGQVAETLEAAVASADLVVLCVPVDRVVEVLREISDFVKSGAVITDVGSTKGKICLEATAVGLGEACFVGSHPMAGSEKSGFKHARVDLFSGKACMVTPTANANEVAVEHLCDFWEGLGMRVHRMDPDVHDVVVAYVSHLPQLVASTLASYLGGKDPKWKALAGNGLKDCIRIAGGDPKLWESIIRENREEILKAISGFKEEWEMLCKAIETEDFEALVEVLERGRGYVGISSLSESSGV